LRDPVTYRVSVETRQPPGAIAKLPVFAR
jgi:hypothetical protein